MSPWKHGLPRPEQIQEFDRAAWIKSLPGNPMTEELLNSIEHQILSIKREREHLGDPHLFSEEMALLHAYRDQWSEVRR